MSADPQSSVYRDEEAPLLSQAAPETEKTYPTETVGGQTVQVNHFAPVPHFEDDAEFIDKQTGRVEEVAKQTPTRPEFVPLFTMAVWLNCLFLLVLLIMAVSLGSILHFYEHPETAGKYIVLAGVVNLTIVFIFAMFFRNAMVMPGLPPMRSFFSELISFLGYFVMLSAFFLYLNGTISPLLTVCLFLTPILLGFVDLGLSLTIKNYSPPANAVVTILVGLQYLVFILNLLYIHSNEWNWVLLLYVVSLAICVIYSTLFAILTVVLVVVWAVKLRRQFHDYLIGTWLLSFLVFISGIGYFGLFMYIGFRRLLEQHAIFDPKHTPAHPDPYLLHVAWATLVFVGVIFLWNLTLFYPVAHKVRRLFILQKLQRRTVYYQNKLLMKIVLVSPDFFKKAADLPADAKSERFSKCFVCVTRDANCMIYPCGHTGACIECVREARTSRKGCMTCKGPVAKVKKIHYDDEDNVFYTTMEDTFPEENRL